VLRMHVRGHALRGVLLEAGVLAAFGTRLGLWPRLLRLGPFWAAGPALCVRIVLLDAQGRIGRPGGLGVISMDAGGAAKDTPG
jgi:hypothetical protein